MLQITAHKAADVQVFGLAGHLCTHTADAAHDHVDAHTGTAGFLQLQDDVAVADGVVLQDHGRRAAHAGGGDQVIHFFQKHALEPQRCHQHLAAVLGQALYGKVLEYVGCFLANDGIGRDKGIIGVQLTGFFVVVTGADLGDVGVALCALAGDEGQLGVHLVIIKAIDNGAACSFQLLGPVNVVLFIKAGAQLHQSHHFLAVFGRFHQRLHDLGFPRHTVEGHLDGNDLRVMCRLFEHGNEGPDRLVRVAEQHIMLLHLGGKIVLRRRQHGPCRRVEQLRMSVCLDPAGELIEEAQIQRAFLHEHPLMGQHKAVAQQAFHLRGRCSCDLQTHSRQLAAALEQIGHDLTVIDIVIHHALFHVDVRIAGHAEQALFLNGILAKNAGRKMQHQLLGEGKQRLAIFFYNVHPFHLAGNGDDAQALPCRVFFPEQYAQIDLLVAQERERMAVIHDLRAEDGEQLGLEIFFPEMLLLLGQMVKVHLAITAFRQRFQRLCVVFVAFFLQLCRFGHDGSQLFRRGHVGLVFPLDLFALFLFQIGALLQRTHAHHEKFVQIRAIDRKKLDPFCKRNIFIFAQCKNALIKIQPAQFPVDKNGFVTHSIPLFQLPCGSAHGCLPFPGIHHSLRQARNAGCILHPCKRAVLLPIFQNGSGPAFSYARQSAQRGKSGCVQIHQYVLFQPCCIRQRLDRSVLHLQRHGKIKRQRCAQDHCSHREADKNRLPFLGLRQMCFFHCT